MADQSNKPNSPRPNRFFFLSNENEQDKEGWYYKAREGIFGPFDTRESAEEDLKSLITHNPNKRRELYRNLGIIIKNLGE